ncbi:hypothetical protein [Chryseobacterium sp. RU33C]|uniref:hypothetical protein n=1 Tax=Chryseobacterium sp. RU33C TaxID=1907398 RepID=UPI0009572D25|nr:hypothetical protein [Chryseobacterium sp. RU33C]SIR65512.1 hypothetical protein SAMN05880573_1323 [Chryseobacterium sp. RU33C]
MKKNFLAVALLATGIIYAQEGRVGINTTTPQATLDIVGKPAVASNVDGIIAPRLTGTELSAKDAVYTSAQTGALVYATSAAPNSGKTTKVTGAGYYYFDGTEWVRIGSGSGTASVTADNGLNMSTANNVQLGGTLLKNTKIVTEGFNTSFTGTGRVGIGTDTPTQSLHVVGQQLIQNQSGSFPRLTLSSNSALDFPRVLFENSTAAAGNIIGLNAFNLSSGTFANIGAIRESGGAGLFFSTREGVSLPMLERMRISENGKIGIGTTIPEASLTIVSQTALPADKALQINNSSNLEMLTLLSNGNLGISSSTPQARLEVKASSTQTRVVRAISPNTDTDLFNVLSSGNVGVGIDSPTQKLDVDGNVRFRQVPLATGTNIKADDKMMVLDADGTAKLYPLPATIKKVSPEQTGNFTFTASDDWDVILYNKDAGANAVLTLPVTGVAPGKTVYVTNVGLGAIDVPSSIMRAAPPSPNIGGGASVTFVFLGPNGGNKWAQVSGF